MYRIELDTLAPGIKNVIGKCLGPYSTYSQSDPASRIQEFSTSFPGLVSSRARKHPDPLEAEDDSP